MFPRTIFFVSLTVFITISVSASGNNCSSSNSRAISFTVRSELNKTGHRHIASNLIVRGSKGKGLNISKDINLEVSQSSCTSDAENQVIISTLLVVPEQKVFPPGYELVPGLGWYRHHLQPLTWDEARLACEAEGAHLAVLNSPEEAAALKGIFARAPNIIPDATDSIHTFIGFSDLTEGHHLTIFGDTLKDAGYDIWHGGQPNNAKTAFDPDQDCGGMYRENGKLNDLACRAKLSYFCEYAF